MQPRRHGYPLVGRDQGRGADAVRDGAGGAPSTPSRATITPRLENLCNEQTRARTLPASAGRRPQVAGGSRPARRAGGGTRLGAATIGERTMTARGQLRGQPRQGGGVRRRDRVRRGRQPGGSGQHALIGGTVGTALGGCAAGRRSWRPGMASRFMRMPATARPWRGLPPSRSPWRGRPACRWTS